MYVRVNVLARVLLAFNQSFLLFSYNNLSYRKGVFVPDFYAHYLHGQKVFDLLPIEISSLISNRKLYNLALQGPDFLCFHKPFKMQNNPVLQLANVIHGKSCLAFLDAVLSKNKIEPCTDKLSYMLGFICHFGLDSVAHPYVNKMTKELNFNHVEIEIEFDKFLLEQNKLVALKYKAHKNISITYDEAKAVSELYSGLLPLIQAKNIKESFDSFKWGKRFFYAPNKISQNLKLYLLKTTGLYNSLHGHIMRSASNEKSIITNKELFLLFNSSIEITAPLIKNFFDHIISGIQLSERFNFTFE